MIFCDAHIHLAQCLISGESGADTLTGTESAGYYACSCAHAQEEFIRMETLLATISPSCGTQAAAAHPAPDIHVVRAFGIHPQAPVLANAFFQEELLRTHRIQAAGEAGFDFFTPEFSAHEREQEEAWHLQLELAATYGVPLINHTRKAQERLFRDSAKLKRLPAVIFHSFMGSAQDARSLLRRGIHGFFSFGKPLLNGKKSAIECVRSLPAECLLLETDAPYQTLKGETATAPGEIARVYKAAADIRGISYEALSQTLQENFFRAYQL